MSRCISLTNIWVEFPFFGNYRRIIIFRFSFGPLIVLNKSDFFSFLIFGNLRVILDDSLFCGFMGSFRAYSFKFFFSCFTWLFFGLE
eukprot:UN00437